MTFQQIHPTLQNRRIPWENLSVITIFLFSRGKVKMTAGASSAEGFYEIHFIPSGKLTRRFAPHTGIGTVGGTGARIHRLRFSPRVGWEAGKTAQRGAKALRHNRLGSQVSLPPAERTDLGKEFLRYLFQKFGVFTIKVNSVSESIHFFGQI